ncbi:hypothetical protein NFC81_08650 [Salinispirillum sp. LH 10-3-1]|uniref:DUF2809 domain-containing protein n=1 Tax=Salinispirillum sp. LH 10-3-1 TaxID=2952525 RepID=A0AB38YBN6_9GAMM
MQVSVFRLNTLRAMYLFIAAGLGFTMWPDILLPTDAQADSYTVISSLLGALGLLCLLGLRYPLKMLPLLIFELLWKLIWVTAFALRMSLDTGLDAYALDTLFACLIGLVLVPLVIPWRYAVQAFMIAKAEPWRRSDVR